jgi:hypothetical protein
VFEMTNQKGIVFLLCLSMASISSCKNSEYKQLLVQASEIDNNICKYAQTLFGDIDSNSGITVEPINPGSDFTSIKATVDNSTKTAIPTYKIPQGTSGLIFPNVKINTTVWCKTRIPAAIKWNTGINYTEQDTADGTCKQVNEYVYATTLAMLTDKQREKYTTKGKPIVFTDDTIVGEGVEFYALDQYSLITDTGTQLSISAASLETAFDSSIPEDDRRGAKYCKIIASQNLLAWMLDGSFKKGAGLTEPDPEELTCDDVKKSVGSCYFINEHSSTYMCEDYIGPNYTGGESGTAKSKCIDKRAGTYVDGVTCADRTDIGGTISGICAINETPDGAYTWTMYSPEGKDECPMRFFTCE